MKLQTLRDNKVTDSLYLVYCFFPKHEACNVDAFGKPDENGNFIGNSKNLLHGKMIKREGKFCGTYYHSLQWYEEQRYNEINLFGHTKLPDIK